MARARVRRVRQLGPAAPLERAPPCPFRRRRPLNGRCHLSLLTSGHFGPCILPKLLQEAVQGNALPFPSFVPVALVSWGIFPASRSALLPCDRRLQSRRRGSHRRMRIRSRRRLRRPWPTHSSALHFCARPTPSLSPDLIRATHARPLHPAALASVPFGFVLVRVRVPVARRR